MNRLSSLSRSSSSIYLMLRRSNCNGKSWKTPSSWSLERREDFETPSRICGGSKVFDWLADLERAVHPHQLIFRKNEDISNGRFTFTSLSFPILSSIIDIYLSIFPLPWVQMSLKDLKRDYVNLQVDLFVHFLVPPEITKFSLIFRSFIIH